MLNGPDCLRHIFGGWVLSQMDKAGGIIARLRSGGPVATIAIDRMEFIAPIHLRDLISVYAEIEGVGRTSMKVRIEVMAWRDSGAIRIKVTEGLFTFVAIDDEAVHGPLQPNGHQDLPLRANVRFRPKADISR